MQSFDFVVAVNTFVAASERVKPELIQTCFHTAGFITYVPPPPEPLPGPPLPPQGPMGKNAEYI